ncbi:MAG: sulfatase-like hydrolase/transferase [Thermoanaerobaculia bacterium]
MRVRVRAALLLAASFSLSCRAREAPSAAAGPPRIARDVLLLTIDTLRADAVGFGGNARGTSPNLDRFASEGRVFSFAHAHNVLTLPSHANILTGLYPYEHGIRDNAGFRLSSKFETMATILKARGFATGAFVAAFPLDSRYGLTSGFDAYEEMYRQVEEPEDFEVQQARAGEVVAAALDWWKSQEGRSRFLWIHVYDPHAPYDPPEEYRKRFPDDLYLGEVASMDAALGPLLGAVRAARPAPLLLATADHGEARGDHGELTHGLFAYEATLRVPLFLWCPDLFGAGKDARPARHVDLLPTVLDTVGASTSARLPGTSLLAAPTAEAETYFESLPVSFNRGWAPLRGLIGGGHKYIDLPIQELYNLASDPREARNLAPAGPDALRRLRKKLLEVPSGPTAREAVGAEEAAKLRSLGYLSGGNEEKASYGQEDDPKNLIAVDRQLHEVVSLFGQERSGEALPIARRLVEENPKMKMGYLQLAFLLNQKGDLAGALRVYEKAESNGLRDESLLRRRAMLLSEMGRPSEAVALLEPYREGEDLETLNALGIALTDAGRPADGLAVFSRAFEIYPRNAQAYQNAGLALIKLERLEEARQNLEKALSISRRSPRALNALGVVWSRLGEPRKAVEAWARCVEVDPEQYDALYNLGRVAGQVGNWELARRALERFAATAPPAKYRRDIADVKAVLAEMNRAGG